MKEINRKSTGGFVGQICKTALYGAALIAAYKAGEYTNNGVIESTTASYSDAVGAIMNGIAYSYNKRDAVEALSRNESAEYYEAVVRIAKDPSMLSHKKVEMIKHLSKI